MTEIERKEILKDIREGFIEEWEESIIDEMFETIDLEHEEVKKHMAPNYSETEEPGQLIKLPVRIGCDIYFIPSKINFKLNILSGYENSNRVYKQKVVKISFTEKGWFLETDQNLENGVDVIFTDKQYKKTWFLSFSDAEQALSKMEDEEEKYYKISESELSLVDAKLLLDNIFLDEGDYDEKRLSEAVDRITKRHIERIRKEKSE